MKRQAVTEYVFLRVERPYCPSCNGESIATYRSMPPEDNSVRRYARCRDCGERFFLVVEWEDSEFRNITKPTE